LQNSRDVVCTQQWQTQDAANNVLDVVVVLVIFEAKLVHALQHSLAVGKPETANVMRK